jgi:hypothetical protein
MVNAPCRFVRLYVNQYPEALTVAILEQVSESHEQATANGARRSPRNSRNRRMPRFYMPSTSISSNPGACRLLGRRGSVWDALAIVQLLNGLVRCWSKPRVTRGDPRRRLTGRCKRNGGA